MLGGLGRLLLGRLCFLTLPGFSPPWENCSKTRCLTLMAFFWGGGSSKSNPRKVLQGAQRPLSEVAYLLLLEGHKRKGRPFSCNWYLEPHCC